MYVCMRVCVCVCIPRHCSEQKENKRIREQERACASWSEREPRSARERAGAQQQVQASELNFPLLFPRYLSLSLPPSRKNRNPKKISQEALIDALFFPLLFCSLALSLSLSLSLSFSLSLSLSLSRSLSLSLSLSFSA